VKDSERAKILRVNQALDCFWIHWSLGIDPRKAVCASDAG
jgi:hypothetical protein